MAQFLLAGASIAAPLLFELGTNAVKPATRRVKPISGNCNYLALYFKKWQHRF